MRNSMAEAMAPALSRGVEQAQGLGASAAKIDFGQSETIGCDFENGRLKQTETTQRVSYTVTVVVNGRRANVTGNDPAEGSRAGKSSVMILGGAALSILGIYLFMMNFLLR